MDLEDNLSKQFSPSIDKIKMETVRKPERPLGVTILAVLAIIGALFSIIFLVSYISFLGFMDSLIPLFVTISMILVMLVLLLLCLLLAYGLWKGLRWSWFFALILVLIGVIVQIITVAFNFSMLSDSMFYDDFGFFYLTTISRVIFILVIYGLILFYLTRPHVKRYFEVEKPSEVISIAKKNKKIIVVLASLFIIVALVLVWGFTPTGEIEILSVSHTPKNPQPGDEITILAEINGGSPFLGASASCEYSSYFGTGVSGGGSMRSIGDNRYSYTLHSSYIRGSEIWYMIHAGDEISESYTIQVGHVERSNISTLSITNVTQDPENPTTETNSVIVTADVSSNVNITEVERMYSIFFPHGSAGGSGGVGHSIDDTYSFSISLGGMFSSSSGDKYYPKGSKVFYRIAAKDELGNTAVTPTYSFTIN